MKPFFLSKGQLYKSEDTLMSGYPKTAADIKKIREEFLSTKPSNLNFLIKKRYAWMSRFIKCGEIGIEIGCGTGLSKLYIHSEKFYLTDCFSNYWVDIVADALHLPFADSSLDYIVCSNTIHHISNPRSLFLECSRVLRKGGRLIIQEINCSFMMRLILRMMRHEGYSYDVDVFSKDAVANDPRDPWSANCAIPNLLFDDRRTFENNFPFFKMSYNKYSEFIIFPLSGGQNSKRKTINLPRLFLFLIDLLDEILIMLAKSVFPLQRKLVLINVKEGGYSGKDTM